MTITCPHCKKRYSIPKEGIKKIREHAVVSCPACKGRIYVGLTVEPAADAAPPAPDAHAPFNGGTLKERLAQTLDSLQLMPQALERARRLMGSVQARPADLAQILAADPTIAARVLTLANSSLCEGTGAVTSIQQAAAMLGMKALNDLLTMACTSGLLGAALSGYGLKAGDLWKHSLATAFCARELAERKAPNLADEAFSSGLLHDCGKLILNSCVEEHRKAFFDCMQDETQSFLDAERRILGFDHPQIAADVCVKWRIPKRQIVAIALHHTPSRFPHNDLAHIVHVADATAMMSGIGLGIDGMLYPLDEASVEFLGLDSDMIAVLMADAVDFVKKVPAGL